MLRVTELKEQLKPKWPETLDEHSRVTGDATTDVVGSGGEESISPNDSNNAEVTTNPQVREPSFVVNGDSGSLVLTAPASVLGLDEQKAWEKAAAPNPHVAYLHGRFVEADAPNRNNAFWSTEDLELAQATVTNGPLNWLHDEKHIIGTLTDSKMVYRETADDVGNHIQAMSAIWKFIYPRETEVIEKASASHTLWYSMECTSETVTCIDGPGRPGCGDTFPYKTVMREPAKVCQHIREKSSIRRFNQPTFLGGAVIIPPVRPGWGKADATIMRQAAEVTEHNHLSDLLDRPDAEQMVAMVIAYANGAL
jgi:hypothetical protein